MPRRRGKDHEDKRFIKTYSKPAVGKTSVTTVPIDSYVANLHAMHNTMMANARADFMLPQPSLYSLRNQMLNGFLTIDEYRQQALNLQPLLRGQSFPMTMTISDATTVVTELLDLVTVHNPKELIVGRFENEAINIWERHQMTSLYKNVIKVPPLEGYDFVLFGVPVRVDHTAHRRMQCVVRIRETSVEWAKQLPFSAETIDAWGDQVRDLSRDRPGIILSLAALQAALELKESPVELQKAMYDAARVIEARPAKQAPVQAESYATGGPVRGAIPWTLPPNTIYTNLTTEQAINTTLTATWPWESEQDDQQET